MSHAANDEEPEPEDTKQLPWGHSWTHLVRLASLNWPLGQEAHLLVSGVGLNLPAGQTRHMGVVPISTPKWPGSQEIEGVCVATVHAVRWPTVFERPVGHNSHSVLSAIF